MGLLSDFTAYVDSLKRRGANTAREFAADPMGLLGRNVSAFSESLPAAPGEPPNEMLARPGMQDWATGVALNAPTMGLLGHTVYHGSPHKFDKFDASKIGTGEGAQAYGHGLYFAENPATARTYSANRAYVGAAMNGKPAGINYDDPRWLAQKAIDEFGDAAKAKAHLEMVARTAAKHQTPETSAAVKGAIELVSNGAVVKNGALYKADLPDEWLPKMLDWDSPLNKQPEGVQAFARKALAPEISNASKVADGWGDLSAPYDAFSELTGRDLVSKLRPNLNASIQNITGGGGPEVSNALRQAGVPGIRYLDQGSRGAGEGSYNYVVFPGMEHLLKILERE